MSATPDFTDEEIEQFRADTPSCARLTHFNNAGMSLSPQTVINTVFAHVAREQRMGGYAAEAHVADRIAAGYQSLAKLVGAKSSEMAFMHNATRAWEMAVAAFPWAAGDRIIAHESEYIANRFSLIALEMRGVSVDRAGSTADGCIDPKSVAALIRPETKLICVTHVPSTHGRINRVADVGKVAKEAGVPMIVDACQSAGQIELDVEALGCDLLAGTGRKYLRGPRGTGFLYVRENLLDKLEPCFPDYHSARYAGPDAIAFMEGAKRFETYEHNVAAKLGLIRAVDYFLEAGPERVEARVRALSDELQEALRVAGMEVLPGQASGIVVFVHPRLDTDQVKAGLAEQGINVSISTRHFEKPAQGLRASVHYYNTSEEIERLSTALSGLVTSH